MVTMVVIQIVLLFYLVGACYCEAPGDVGIIGGHQVTITRAPYMVSLRIDAIHHWCGGSIINEQYILTAAHCIKSNRTYKVMVGTDRINNNGILYDIEKIIVHEKYDNKTFNFDVCLIKLSKPLVFNDKVAPIKLANNSLKLRKNDLLNVTGWGSTGSNPYSSHLLQVAIPFVKKDQCQFMYLSHRFKITQQMLCAGKRGEDFCQGDSGGPLTKGDVQVGITSYGLGCGQVPGVYVKVSTVLPWITRTIARNSTIHH